MSKYSELRDLRQELKNATEIGDLREIKRIFLRIKKLLNI